MTCLNHASLAASLAALTVAADAAAASKPESASGKRPGIIVIMTDQQTAAAMSCAGNPWVRTPAMDALAADGVRFTRAYCPFPLSGPCRASLVTGRMPFEVGAFDNAIRPNDADMRAGIGHRLAEAGYECLYAGKWHVPEVNLPDSGTGFRRISKMDDPALADACDAALREYDGQKPLFLVASLLNPHEICEYGRNETLQYGELAPFSTDECPNLPANFMPSTYAAEALTLEHASSPRYHDTYTYTQDDWRRYLYAYYRLVERVDREVGRIVGVLKARGLYDDSAIIFLSDHGDGVAAHGWNQKWNLQEEVVNVPLIVKAPEGAGLRGVRNDEALSNVGLDLYATVCDYAGVAPDPGALPRAEPAPRGRRPSDDASRRSFRRDAPPRPRHARLVRRRPALQIRPLPVGPQPRGAVRFAGRSRRDGQPGRRSPLRSRAEPSAPGDVRLGRAHRRSEARAQPAALGRTPELKPKTDPIYEKPRFRAVQVCVTPPCR